MSGTLPGVGSPLFAAAERHVYAAVLLARENDTAAMWALLDGLTRDEVAMLALRAVCSLAGGPVSTAALRRELMEAMA